MWNMGNIYCNLESHEIGEEKISYTGWYRGLVDSLPLEFLSFLPLRAML